MFALPSLFRVTVISISITVPIAVTVPITVAITITVSITEIVTVTITVEFVITFSISITITLLPLSPSMVAMVVTNGQVESTMCCMDCDPHEQNSQNHGEDDQDPLPT